MKRFLTFPCLFLALCTQAQVVDSVVVEGLKRLRPDFVALFLIPCTGESADSVQAAIDCRNLQQLPAVYSADVHWEAREGKFCQVYSIQEQFTLIPYGSISQGGAQTSRTLQLGLSEYNAFGRGVWIRAMYQYKERHAGQLTVRVPFVGGSPWTIEATGKYWNTVEPLYFTEDGVRYNYENRLVQLGVSRVFDFTTEVGIRAAVFDEEYNRIEDHPDIDVPTREYFAKVLGQAYLRFNNRDYQYFYVKGWLAEARATTVATQDVPDQSFVQVDLDVRHFQRPYSRLNVGGRFLAGIASNNMSPYAPYVYDSQINLRGAGDRIARGTGGLFLNAEVRWTALDRTHWAAQLVGFTDAGWLRAAGAPGMSDVPEWYVGGGGRLHIKRFYNAVFRLDYGYSFLKGGGGFVVGLGQFF